MAKKPESSFVGGFVRDRGEGRGVRVAMTKPDEINPINPHEGAARLAESMERKNPNSFPSGPSPAKVRKTKLAVMGLSSEILDKGDPRYAACIRLANSYRKSRTREYCISHGYVSSGVSALLASSAMALAGARYLYEVASQAEGVGKAEILKKASSLSDSSRQSELAAWELCAREAVVRKKMAQDKELPWVISVPQVEEKRKRGRPRKLALALEQESKSHAQYYGQTSRTSTQQDTGVPENGPGSQETASSSASGAASGGGEGSGDWDGSSPKSEPGTASEERGSTVQGPESGSGDGSESPSVHSDR